jgi:methylenetetrahydrofolate dehydrogenase (NADP+)/methenyltetrahydrofolate cyclohydrolase
MYKTLSGKEPAAAILEDVEKRAKVNPAKLVIVQVGDNPASTSYVNMKVKRAAKVGMQAEIKRLPESAKESDLLALVDELGREEGDRCHRSGKGRRWLHLNQHGKACPWYG